MQPITCTRAPLQAQRNLDDAAFKAECRGWDVSDALIADNSMWATYVALMRADFKLFDEYAFGRAGQAPFSFPITTFYAVADRKVTRQMVARWAEHTSGAFVSHEVKGHHLFVMASGEQKPAKEAWLTTVVDELKKLA